MRSISRSGDSRVGCTPRAAPGSGSTNICKVCDPALKACCQSPRRNDNLAAPNKKEEARFVSNSRFRLATLLLALAAPAFRPDFPLAGRCFRGRPGRLQVMAAGTFSQGNFRAGGPRLKGEVAVSTVIRRSRGRGTAFAIGRFSRSRKKGPRGDNAGWVGRWSSRPGHGGRGNRPGGGQAHERGLLFSPTIGRDGGT